MDIEVTNWDDAKAWVKPIRYEVFVKEQGIPESLEWDEFDQNAWHAILKLEGHAIATGRLILDGPTAKVGRMAVDTEQRAKGYGRAVLLKLIAWGKEKGVQVFILHAQTHAIPFYAKEGFEPHGPIFDEVGMDHVEMRLEL